MATVRPTYEGWTLNKVLGAGGFGKVELWVHVQSGDKLAIKECKWDSSQLTEIQRKRWANEVQIMQCLTHPNIVKAINMPFKLPNEKGDLPVLCMEYCRKGNLRRVLNKPENCCGVAEKQAISVMRDISLAVEYLHSKNITHRDLKPENIVLQDEGNKIVYKLIDLGYAKDLGEASASASIVGTLNYVAPELLWNEKYSCSVDYWSLGILFYELVTGTRPFLPNMQHTIKWMQHIKSKGYNDICAYESEGKIIFKTDIQEPTDISRCFKGRLAGWFRVVLQWDPKKRGRQFDENGTSELVVFKLLHTILSRKIVYIFFVPLYKLYAYEVSDITTVAEVQRLIEKDSSIPVNHQILTDYFGKVLPTNEVPLLSKIHDDVVFLFKSGNTFMENAPVLHLPTKIQKIIEFSRRQLEFETLKDYYRSTVFFLKKEAYLFKLYIFALTIKVDLITSQVNTFSENIRSTLASTNVLMEQLQTIRGKLQRENVDRKRIKALDTYFEKVNKLINAAEQIKTKFNPLIQKSEEVRIAAQCIDSIPDVSRLYDKVLAIYEALKKEHVPKDGKPTEMVKSVCQFLKVRLEQLQNKDITDIIRQISNLEAELLTLERIFDSVIALEMVYREGLQSITQSDQQCTVRNSPSTSAEVSGEFGSNKSSNTSMGYNDVMDKDKDVIYDNLVIRYTLDNLLVEMQKRYLEMVSLDP